MWAKCAPELDEDDVDALMRAETFREAIHAINWMVDGSETAPEKKPDGPPVPTADEEDSETEKKSV